jgi:hypothetical protein
MLSKGALLGDERVARTSPQKDKSWLEKYEAAIRANRQLALVLQSQGMNEVGAELAYRSQVLRRVVLHQQRRWAAWLASWTLGAIAGYGYRPWRAFGAYVCTLAVFTAAYFAVPRFWPTARHLTLVQDILLSVLSFHGRGLLPTQGMTTDEPYSIVAAVEAFFGLVIEATFIATLTQRFFR